MNSIEEQVAHNAHTLNVANDRDWRRHNVGRSAVGNVRWRRLLDKNQAFELEMRVVERDVEQVADKF